MKKQKLQRFGTRNLESGICFSMTSEIDDSFLSSTLFLLTEFSSSSATKSFL